MKIDSPETMMAHHGKSFYFASQVFSKKVFIRISYLYAFCRFVDDTADEQSADLALKDLNEITEILTSKSNTLTGAKIRTSNKFSEPSKPVVNTSLQISISDLVLKLDNFGVKKEHLNVLVNGALFDVTGQIIKTKKDLIRYCYHVAGVVGLMMCPLILVRQKKAYAFAIDLGIGMQLTNICRDILEDAKNKRLYLPEQDLNPLNLDVTTLAHQGLSPENLKLVVKKYLDVADLYYKSSFLGLAYIPFRPRLAILFASDIYRSIGTKIRKNNYEVLYGRTYLSTLEKVIVSVKSVIKIFHIRFWFAGYHNVSLHTDIEDLI